MTGEAKETRKHLEQGLSAPHERLLGMVAAPPMTTGRRSKSSAGKREERAPSVHPEGGNLSGGAREGSSTPAGGPPGHTCHGPSQARVWRQIIGAESSWRLANISYGVTKSRFALARLADFHHE